MKRQALLEDYGDVYSASGVGCLRHGLRKALPIRCVACGAGALWSHPVSTPLQDSQLAPFHGPAIERHSRYTAIAEC